MKNTLQEAYSTVGTYCIWSLLSPYDVDHHYYYGKYHEKASFDMKLGKLITIFVPGRLRYQLHLHVQGMVKGDAWNLWALVCLLLTCRSPSQVVSGEHSSLLPCSKTAVLSPLASRIRKADQFSLKLICPWKTRRMVFDCENGIGSRGSFLGHRHQFQRDLISPLDSWYWGAVMHRHG